jgi:hypothetical protein
MAAPPPPHPGALPDKFPELVVEERQIIKPHIVCHLRDLFVRMAQLQERPMEPHPVLVS